MKNLTLFNERLVRWGLRGTWSVYSTLLTSNASKTHEKDILAHGTEILLTINRHVLSAILCSSNMHLEAHSYRFTREYSTISKLPVSRLSSRTQLSPPPVPRLQHRSARLFVLGQIRWEEEWGARETRTSCRSAASRATRKLDSLFLCRAGIHRVAAVPDCRYTREVTDCEPQVNKLKCVNE